MTWFLKTSLCNSDFSLLQKITITIDSKLLDSTVLSNNYQCLGILANSKANELCF